MKIASKGPYPGFSKGINDALIAASTLVHFKASGLLGFALTLSGLVISHRPSGSVSMSLHFFGILLLISSACFAGAVIFPVKQVRRGGHIFWGDIATHASASAYAGGLEQLSSAEDVEREYAYTNYRLSRVLDGKYRFMRWAICLLLLGAAFSGAGRIFQ